MIEISKESCVCKNVNAICWIIRIDRSTRSTMVRWNFLRFTGIFEFVFERWYCEEQKQVSSSSSNFLMERSDKMAIINGWKISLRLSRFWNVSLMVLRRSMFFVFQLSDKILQNILSFNEIFTIFDRRSTLFDYYLAQIAQLDSISIPLTRTILSCSVTREKDSRHSVSELSKKEKYWTNRFKRRRTAIVGRIVSLFQRARLKATVLCASIETHCVYRTEETGTATRAITKKLLQHTASLRPHFMHLYISNMLYYIEILSSDWLSDWLSSEDWRNSPMDTITLD